MTARQEHLEWAKERAYEYLPRDVQGAWTSFASDLRSHPELADHPGLGLGLLQLMSGFLQEPRDMREFIRGFR